MSASQRNKGARGEREVAALFKAYGWPNAARRASGEESQEAKGRDLKNVEPFCVQVNLSARPNPLKKLAEAEQAAKADEIPVAFCRKTNGKWTVTLAADMFMYMARQYRVGAP